MIDSPSLKSKYYKLRPQINHYDHENCTIKILINNRCIDNLEYFLNKKIIYYWPKVADIPNLDITIDFLESVKDKTIGIVGDYDVDGISATSLLIKFLEYIGVKYMWVIPNRFEDGYGISIPIVNKLTEAEIIVTIDNGTTAYEVIEYLKDIGKPLVIIDHHSIQKPIDVKYFINPQGTEYRILCATGLTFVLLSEWNKKYNHQAPMRDWVDLVGLATICDVMPLVGINRALVDYSIKKIRQSPMGFTYGLLGESHKQMDARKFGFLIGPHINAPGRMGNTQLSLDFILNPSKQNLAEIILLNHKRRAIEAEIYGRLSPDNNKNYIYVAEADLHEGVIGIIAGKLKETYEKPTIVLTFNGEVWKGSFRSTDHWNVGEFIKKLKTQGIILHGGGHAKAGGIVIEPGQLNKLQELLYDSTREVKQGYSYIDIICSLSAANKQLSTHIDTLAPFGELNPQPLLLFTNCYIVDFEIINEDCRFYFSNNQVTKVIRVFNIYKSGLTELCHKGIKAHIICSIENGFLSMKDAILQTSC